MCRYETPKVNSVSGSMLVRLKEWKLRVACTRCADRSCRRWVHDWRSFIANRNDEREREQMGEGIQTTTTSECFCYCQQERRESESRWTREYKPQQRQNTSEDKALFEAASRARSLSINDARMILQVLLNTKGNNQRGSAESAVAAPPAIDS
jgi:hypothetical protein